MRASGRAESPPRGTEARAPSAPSEMRLARRDGPDAGTAAILGRNALRAAPPLGVSGAARGLSSVEQAPCLPRSSTWTSTSPCPWPRFWTLGDKTSPILLFLRRAPPATRVDPPCLGRVTRMPAPRLARYPKGTRLSVSACG